MYAGAPAVAEEHSRISKKTSEKSKAEEREILVPFSACVTGIPSFVAFLPHPSIFFELFLWITLWISMRTIGDKQPSFSQALFSPKTVLWKYIAYAALYPEAKFLKRKAFTRLSTGEAAVNHYYYSYTLKANIKNREILIGRDCTKAARSNTL